MLRGNFRPVRFAPSHGPYGNGSGISEALRIVVRLPEKPSGYHGDTLRWPKVVPAGTVCHEPTSGVDFYPTLPRCAGVRPDRRQHLDGVSILPLLSNPKSQLNRDALYWHYPLGQPHFLGGRSSGAIRQGGTQHDRAHRMIPVP